MNLMVFNFLSIVHYSITLLCGRVMLLCAGILGRYYTDGYDVDGDERASPEQGGRWMWGNNSGITHRDINDAPTTVSDGVASRK